MVQYVNSGLYVRTKNWAFDIQQKGYGFSQATLFTCDLQTIPLDYRHTLCLACFDVQPTS